MDIKFREAQPSDVSSAVPLIYSSGPHEFDYACKLGNRTAFDFLTFAFPTGRGTLGYCVHTVATIDDQVVGIGAFYGDCDYARLNREDAWNFLRHYGLINALKIGRRGSQLATIMPPPDTNAEYFGHIGVKEELRGHGIGMALLQRQIDIARAKKRQKCVLDVATTNCGAQRLYERLGFKVAREMKWNYHNSHTQVSDTRRMGLIL